MADRKKVISDLAAALVQMHGCGRYTPEDVDELEKTAWNALKLLESQGPKYISISNMKWVSVNDAKPKSMANKVIVWLEHEDLVGYIGYGHYEKYKGEEMWFDLEFANGEQFIKRGYRVTHWMPLPEPPKEDKA